MQSAAAQTAAKQEVKVFWQPGCTSCLRVKEFLSVRGIAFTSVNVIEDAAALGELQARGITKIPAVSRGDEFVFGQSLNDISRFMGIDEKFRPGLSPTELMSRLDRFILAAERFQRQIPDSRFRDILPDESLREILPVRPRPLRVLAHHMFRIPAGFLEAMRGAKFSEGIASGRPDDSMRRFEDIVRFGESVRADLAGWWESQDDKSCTWRVEAYWGRPSAHELLERTTWHIAQHCRQVMWYLDALGIPPDGPLQDGDFKGLPMPENIWDG